MQGIMFIELSRFIDDRLGPGEWEKALKDAGLSERNYNPRSPSPDEEFIALVTGVATTEGEPVQAILEAFGEYIAPDLLGGLYGLLLDADWDLLDFLSTRRNRSTPWSAPATRPPSPRDCG
jgi:hypothetical protein